MKCTAHRSNGTTCNAWAVKGTTVCRVHGGTAPQTRAAATRRREEEKAKWIARTLIKNETVDPAQALIDLVYSTRGEVTYWETRVAELQEQDEKRLTTGLTKVTEGKEKGGVTTLRTVETIAAIEYRMLIDAKQRLMTAAATALKAGVDERQVRLAENQGAQTNHVIRQILDALDLTEEQRALIPTIVPKALRSLGNP